MSNLAKWRRNPCPTCKAKPGQYCLSAAGREAPTWVHTARKGIAKRKYTRKSTEVPAVTVVPVTPQVQTPSIAAQLAAQALALVTANDAVFLVTMEKESIRVDASRTPEGIVDIRIGGLLSKAA